MKLLSYGKSRHERGGLLCEGSYVDLEATMQQAGIDHPVSSIKALLMRNDWHDLLPRMHKAAAHCPQINPSTVRLGAPIPKPNQVMLAGVNFRSHQKEILNDSVPTRPVVLGKIATAVVGPADEIVRPPEIEKLDYEGEVAVIIGKPTRRVSVANVRAHIAGYTVINDVSGRDLQLAEYETNPFFRMHYLGKSADTFAPLGPYLVTTDEFSPDTPFRIQTWVNGELRQDGDTDSLLFSIDQFISYVSQFVTLQPGDVIATGTPGGVGHAMKPPSYLRDGDVVRIEVAGIGAIENRVRDEVVLEVAAALKS